MFFTWTVSGKLTDQSGKGVPNQKLEIRDFDPARSQKLLATVTTGKDGSYSCTKYFTTSQPGEVMVIYNGNNEYWNTIAYAK